MQSIHASTGILHFFLQTFLEASDAVLETSVTWLALIGSALRKIRVSRVNTRLSELSRWTFLCGVSRCITPTLEDRPQISMENGGTVVEGRRDTNEEIITPHV